MGTINDDEKQYTNQENTWAAQIAYCNIDDTLIRDTSKWLKDTGINEKDEDPTFSQIIKYCNSEGIALWYDGEDNNTKEFLNNASSSEYGNWKIVSVCDKNEETGLYAVAIETGNYTHNGVDNGIILAARGTELTKDQTFLDLVATDLNFANSDITSQEQALNKYVDEELTDLIRERGYSNLAIAGHSLGGYLGFEAAAHIATSNPLLFELFMQATGIDNPGVTEENYAANKEAYDLIKDRCYQYHYTMVGSLLNSICDEDHYISIKGASDWQKYANNPNLASIWFLDFGTTTQMDNIAQYLSGSFFKHTLPSLCFTEEGEFDIDAITPPSTSAFSFSSIGIADIAIQIIFQQTYNWLVHLDNEDEDALAQIAGTLTKDGERADFLQIVIGAIVETAIEEVYFLKHDFSQDFEEFKADVQTAFQQQLGNNKTVLDSFEKLMCDFAGAAMPFVINNSQSAGTLSSRVSTAGVNSWFQLLTDIQDLKASGVNCITGNGVVAPDPTEIVNDFRIVGDILVDNILDGASEFAREIVSTDAEFYQSLIIEGTQEIISEVESWDALAKCTSAQNTLTANFLNHLNQVKSNLNNCGISVNDVTVSLQAYGKTLLELYTGYSAVYAGYLKTGNISVSSSQRLSNLQKNMSDATNQLLTDVLSLGQNGRQAFADIGILVRDGINDSFGYLYSLGELKLSETIIDAANSLNKYVKDKDVPGIVDGWFLRAKGHNGATDVIYGVDGKIDIIGTDEAETIYGTGDGDHILGNGEDDIIYGEGGNDKLEGGSGNDIIYGGAGYDYLLGDNGDDEIHGENGNDQIYGGQGADTLYGNDGEDIIKGESGNDTLFGDSENDVLEGGDGNDALYGGTGNDQLLGDAGEDTYYINIGDGIDTIYDYEYYRGNANDSIVFGGGISPDKVKIERINNELLIIYDGDSGAVLVQKAYDYYHTSGEYFVENIRFADGTVWDTEEIANRANVHIGTAENEVFRGLNETIGYHHGETFNTGAGDDAVYSGDGNDTINGEEGNDSLYGENGDDSLNGGVGNDYLSGGDGEDTFIFNLGDGTDTVFDYEYYRGNANDRILFGEGISPDTVRIERVGSDLQVIYSSKDCFTVKDAYSYYHTSGEYFVENIEFADGTVWDTEKIANLANIHHGSSSGENFIGYDEAVGYHQSETFYAGAGNDTVHAGVGNDTIYGEKGNDSLHGEDGNDTLIGGKGTDDLYGDTGEDKYIFNLGDGTDKIYDYEYYRGNANDRILFGEGISPESVQIERVGDDLVVKYSARDSFIVQGAYQYYHTSGEYFVENIEFADGTVWDTEEIANRANIHKGSLGDDSLTNYGETVGYHQNETFYAGNGNDTVRAGVGNGVLHGEKGNDNLYGEDGNDTLIGGKGLDYVDGGSGEDTFVFNIGDGTDTIFDYEYYRGNANDRILFGEGVTPESVRIERVENDLVVKYTSKDSFTVKDAYAYYHTSGEYFIENIEFADGTVWDTEEIANRANIHIGTSGDDTLVSYGETVGYHQDETFYAGAGNDKITAGDGADFLYGEKGNDELYGENGNDTLVGGKGSDYVDGGAGEDRFVFNLGDGVDTVFDYEYYRGNANDRIVFGEGISQEDVRLERIGNDMKVWYSKKDNFIVKDAYAYYHTAGEYFVENIEFADGTVWDTEEIANRANIHIGTSGDDTLVSYGETVGYHQDETFYAGAGNDKVTAGDGADFLYGEKGNDELYGENGNDTLVGGKGSDYVDGGAGEDRFVFNLGDGVDTVFDYEYYRGNANDRIVFGEGISQEDVRLERIGNDIVVKYSKKDSFIVKDAYSYYHTAGEYFVENIEFSDGTVWDTEEIAKRANKLNGTKEADVINGFGDNIGYSKDETIHGRGGNDAIYANDGNDTIFGDEGDDSIYGGNGEDVLNGGTGNDHLDGGTGNDTYVFKKGDGNDTIFDYEDSDISGKEDKILFGKGVLLDDVSLQRDGNNLIVKYSKKDQITIDSAYRDYYGIGKYQIEQVEFEDGTKTIIDYDKESLVVTYQPEPVEEPVQTETEETPVSEETVDVPVQEEIVTEEISLSKNDIAAETEEVFELDEVVAAVEEVLNTDIVETDQEFELSEEPDVLVSDYIDIEMEQATNLLVQEMSASIEGNISELLTEEQPILIVDELLWTE